jgi:type IV pilus assembly protein PilB
VTPKRRRLGEVLVAAKTISRKQLNAALKHQQNVEGRKPRLGTVIVDLGFASEEEIAQAVAKQMQIAYVDLASVVPDPEVTKLVPRSLARKHQLVPIRHGDEGLVVAITDPTNVVGVDDVRTASGIKEVSVVVSTASAIRESEDRFYAPGLGAADILDRFGVASEIEVIQDEPEDQAEAEAGELESLQRSAHMAPVVRLVNAIFADAVRARVTDIHIEPQPAEVKVRYRVDGLLREVLSFPKRIQALVISRIKIVVGMDIAERRRPQDGRAKFSVDGREVDSRVSSIPTFFGEKIVIRLLPAGQQFVKLDELGFEDSQLAVVKEHLDKPQGLIIFTGPTGAGKTSTMYAALSHILSPEKNIVTLEDPIEYQLPELNQTQIDDRSDITFARGLRTVLRQDPDVIMVGEIRDFETAQIVMQAALTGHTVLSSLHTNDAASVINRLIDLGIEPYMVASGLILAVAQRLIRVVCNNCAEPSEVSERAVAQFGLSTSDFKDATLRKGTGCEICDYTGYRGRTGIFEVLPITQQIRDQLAIQVSDSSLGYAVRDAGVLSLQESGLAKVKAGITTLEEVMRVTYVEREQALRCPSCREEIDSAWLVCPYCQHDLSARKCDGCGRDVRPDWRVCPYCRTELSPRAGGDEDTRRVLVVDDDPSLGELIETMFGDDYDVLIAKTGDEGLRRARLERPDLILLDLHMPDISGLEIAKKLRNAAATSMIPLIMLTGDETSELAGLRAGVDDYVMKPFEEENLRARMESVLRRASRG